jgi:hypothetical protein
MKAPSRSSSSFKDTITEFLKNTPLSEGARKFFIRLRVDEDKCVDRIWQTYVDKGLPDNAENRAIFMRMLKIMWKASERAVERAARVDLERAVDKSQALEMGLIAKIILDERFSPETKAQVTDWASKVFKHDAEYRKLDSGTDNFLSGDGPLLNIRSDHAGSRQRTAFMRVSSNYFHQTMGQWHDDWVADLTNAAFPDHDTTIDTVRSARRGIRPTPKR